MKPDLRIYRAKFSEITAPSVRRALNTLEQPNRNVSEAVDVRQELDLRTGNCDIIVIRFIYKIL